MRAVYRILAYLMALEVVVQAAAIAYAMFGLSTWIEGGGVLDKAVIESDAEPPFAGVVGFMIHGMNGTMIVPAIAILLLVVSFFVRLPRAVAYAGAVFVAVALQIALGIFAHTVPALGMLHGALALVLLVVAIMAGRLAAPSPAPAATPASPAEMV